MAPAGSLPFAQGVEVAELLAHLDGDAARLVRAADGEEVAPGARALRRRRREEAELDRAVDDFQRLEAEAGRVVVQPGLCAVAEAAGGGAVIQGAAGEARAERGFDGHRIEERLQHGSAANHRLLR